MFLRIFKKNCLQKRLSKKNTLREHTAPYTKHLNTFSPSTDRRDLELFRSNTCDCFFQTWRLVPGCWCLSLRASSPPTTSRSNNTLPHTHTHASSDPRRSFSLSLSLSPLAASYPPPGAPIRPPNITSLLLHTGRNNFNTCTRGKREIQLSAWWQICKILYDVF